MHTDVEPHYLLKLTAAEFRLIGLGLAGKLKDKEDITAAKTLNVHLTAQRVNHLKSQLDTARAAANLAVQEEATIERGQQ